MNAAVLSSALTCIFFLFLILGFLYGLWRGFSKSLTRLIIVVAVAVATFFIVPKLTNILLTADISSFNIEVNGVVMQNVEQFIIDYLSQIEMVNNLINASPTFMQFIQVLPQILVNIVLFIVLFMLLKMVSMIIYWIVAAIFFPKKKTAGKNKHRFVGAIVGAVQGLLVAVVVMIPVFGLVNLADNAQTALSASKAEIQASQTADTNEPITLNGHIFYTQEPEEQPENSSNEASIDAALETVKEYTTALEENFIYKTLNSIGIIKLSNAVFDELTSVTVEKEEGQVEYKFTTEAVKISEIYPYIELVIESEIDIQNKDFIDTLILLTDKAYESPLIGDILTEIIKEAATIWTDESKPREERLFLGIAAPNINNDEDLNTILDNELKKLKSADKETLKETLVGVFKIAQVAISTQEMVNQMEGSLENITTENLTDLFETIVSNDSVKELVSEVVTPERLENMGVDASTAEIVSNVVTSIVNSDPETLEKEVAATKEIFALTEKISNSGSEQITLEQQEVDTLVESLANSTVITEMIVENIDIADSAIQNLGIDEKIDQDTKDLLASSIQEKVSANEMTEETKAALEKIFGLLTQPA